MRRSIIGIIASFHGCSYQQHSLSHSLAFTISYAPKNHVLSSSTTSLSLALSSKNYRDKNSNRSNNKNYNSKYSNNQKYNKSRDTTSNFDDNEYSNSNDPFMDYDDGYYSQTQGNDDDYDINFNDDNFDFSYSDPIQRPNQSPSSNNNNNNNNKEYFFSIKPLTDPSFSTQFSKSILRELCQAAHITQPSRIQALAWPYIIEGKTTLIAEQTGSGKTLAYLIPLLQRMLQNTPNTSGTITSSNKKQYGAPKILILAPTAELADQIKLVCDNLSSSSSPSSSVSSFTSKVITSSGKYETNIRDQIRLLERNTMDVLISTPGRIATLLRTKHSPLDLSSLQAVVLDEVDVLLIDETFGPQLRTVGAAISAGSGTNNNNTNNNNANTQFVFVTATLPDEIISSVQKEFPSTSIVKGPGLHRLPPSVKEHLVDVSVPSSENRNTALGFEMKLKCLAEALRTNRTKRTLIFCNTVESCRKVENYIKRSDRRRSLVEVGAYHNAMTAEARIKSLEIFSHGLLTQKDEGGKSSSSYDDQDYDVVRNKKKRKEDVNYILVCTDRAARGVDFDGVPVDHVVIFDFPKDPAEYVRRVGRTGRAGRPGTCTVFAYGWQIPIARKIMGKKLENYTVGASSDGGDGGENVEYTTKQRREKREKDKMIGKNIQQGRLWE